MSNYGINGHQLEIEITESAIASSEQMAIQNLKGLQAMGCEIAIDDFGTGYSSLGNLKNFPLNRLKIDKSFVDSVVDSESGQSIVRMISTLARELNLKVTAEGVETREQAEFLKDVGCDQLQGYLFSKPLQAGQFYKRLQQLPQNFLV